MSYIRPTTITESFVNTSGNHNKHYEVRYDLHNRRVTLSWGRIGAEPRVRVHTFATRDEAREFVEQTVATRLAHGYKASRIAA